MPTVSVIIPTYNRADYLIEAVESVFSQTFDDYEIIIVDDGSTDNTRECLEPLIAENKVRYFYQDDRSKSAARNMGIKLASGKYIAFLDSDDIFLPTKLEKQVLFLDQNTEVGFVHSWFSKFDDAGNHLGTRDTSKYTGWVYPEILLSWSVLMALPCMMVRPEVLEEVSGFDIAQKWGEDVCWIADKSDHPHEAGLLKLDCSKARTLLKWQSQLNIEKSMEWTVQWYKDFYSNSQSMKDVTLNQIKQYENSISAT